MKWAACFSVLTVCSLLVFTPLYGLAAGDRDSVETTFNELCGRTEHAETLSAEEITSMIARCDSLMETITKGTHPRKKVLLFRLKKCRNFLEYILETKKPSS
jgi:hypothetical protein